jgi:peptide deformylase
MSAIKYFGEPVLRKRTAPVSVFDPVLRDLADRMARAMHEARGVGLAAPQIGEGVRMIVVDLSAGDRENELMAFVNPRITRRVGSFTDDEGCLSFPGLRLPVARAFEVTVEGADLSGNPVCREARGMLARVLQHEIDHLDGILLVDRLPWRIRLRMLFKLPGLKRRYRAARESAGTPSE